MGRKKHNQLVQHNHHHQISSFNLACCLRPPPPPPALVDVDSRRTTPQLIKSSTLTSSTSSSSQLFKPDEDGWGAIVDEGPASPEVGCMGQVRRRNDSKRRLQSRRFSRMLFYSVSMGKSAKVEDHCSSGRREAEYVAKTMDPPLPVPKRDILVVVDSLWKRRHGTDGAGLESLNVQQLKMQQAQLHLHIGFGCSRHLEA